MKRLDGAFKDAHNYIVTCATIDGDGSDPIYVTSSGFDPSLFHDDDGRKWFTNMRWNHRPAVSGLNRAHDRFDGIELLQWHPEHGLLGEVATIYTGTTLGLTEAPHIFKRNGWYYLTTAEGGTGYDHAETMARSRKLHGPYETHPNQHLMTARFAPGNPIQRVGHGQYVEGPAMERRFTAISAAGPCRGRVGCSARRGARLGWRNASGLKIGFTLKAVDWCRPLLCRGVNVCPARLACMI